MPALASLALGAATATQAAGPVPAQTAASCDRSCLKEMLETYLAALPRHDAVALRWMAGAKFAENTVALRPGEGLWQTAGPLGEFRYEFFDPALQSAVFLGTIDENGNQAIVGIRLKIVNGEVAEAEHLVSRNPAAAAKFAMGRAGLRPLRAEGKGADRQALAAAPDAYFDGIAQVSAADVPFAENCVRVENGQQTTGIRDLARGPFLELDSPSWRGVLAEGCRASIDSGANAHITATTHRRLLAVDEEAGVAIAGVVFEHTGTVAEIERGGRRIVFPRQLRQPFDTAIFEAFALDQSGRIDHIEAIGNQLPFRTGSGW